MNVHVSSVHAWMRMHGTTIFSPLNIPASGAGRAPALAAIAQTERSEPGLFNRMMRGDTEARDKFQRAVDDAVANPDRQTVRQPAAATEGQVRVTGACVPIRLCFWPGAAIRNNATKMREFRRQRAIQERGLNALSPSTVVSNRAAWFASPRLPDPSQTLTRAAYQAAYTRRLAALDRVLRGRAALVAAATRSLRVRAHMRTVAALNNPDRIAGGNPTVVFGPTDAAAVLAGGSASSVGPRDINSSIGSLWGGCAAPNSNSSRLARHAARQAANGCPSVQASLEVCQN
jgi:Novel toxin 15